MLQEGHATLYSHFTFTQEGGFHAFADSKKQGFHHNPAAIRLDRFDVATKIKEKC